MAKRASDRRKTSRTRLAAERLERRELLSFDPMGVQVFRPSPGLWIDQAVGPVESVANTGPHVFPVNYHESGSAMGPWLDLPAVFDPATDDWYIETEIGATRVVQFGNPAHGDIPVPGDYDGDGTTDLAVFDPTDDNWIIRASSTGQKTTIPFGDPSVNLIPVPGDYDGDGRTDLALFNPANDYWIIRDSSTGQLDIRRMGDPASPMIPVPGYYEVFTDPVTGAPTRGKEDLALFNPNGDYWIIRLSTGAAYVDRFGNPTQNDFPVGGPLEYANLLGGSPQAPGSTTTQLITSGSPSTAGQAVMFAAVVAAFDGAVPTGNVAFQFGSASIVEPTQIINGRGVALLTTAPLPVGTYTVSAVYTGAPSFASSTSNAISEQVNPVQLTGLASDYKGTLQDYAYNTDNGQSALVQAVGGDNIYLSNIRPYSDPEGDNVAGTLTITNWAGDVISVPFVGLYSSDSSTLDIQNTSDTTVGGVFFNFNFTILPGGNLYSTHANTLYDFLIEDERNDFYDVDASSSTEWFVLLLPNPSGTS